MPFRVLGSGPRLVCQLIPRTLKGLQTGSMWGREPRDLPLGCFPISPTWSLESPTPACASVTWSPVQLHRELPVLCALSA